jgi:hypothetical protein
MSWRDETKFQPGDIVRWPQPYGTGKRFKVIEYRDKNSMHCEPLDGQDQHQSQHDQRAELVEVAEPPFTPAFEGDNGWRA